MQLNSLSEVGVGWGISLFQLGFFRPKGQIRNFCGSYYLQIGFHNKFSEEFFGRVFTEEVQHMRKMGF